MKTNYLCITMLFCLLVGPLAASGQPQSPFTIIRGHSTHGSGLQRSAADFVRRDTVFYADEDYIVSADCRGEWGGVLIFQNKHTGKEYWCAATCPVSLYYLNGRYTATTTLDHLISYGAVLEIADPSRLQPVPSMQSHHSRSQYTQDTIYRHAVYRKIDTVGVSILASFPYQHTMYYIISSDKGTSLSVLSAGLSGYSFSTIDTISTDRIRATDPSLITTVDGHYIFLFDPEKRAGYIDIFEDKIKVVR